MDSKPFFPSLFNSYTHNHRLESFQFEYSPSKYDNCLLTRIRKPSQNWINNNNNNNHLLAKEQLSTASLTNLTLPLFNNDNTTIENFALVNAKPPPEEADNSIHIGRYINNKEMMAKLVYSKTVLKDNRLNFDNKVIDNHFIPSSMPFFPYYSLKNKNDETLVFESRFESGNLLAAFKVGAYSYELVLSNDTNTLGFSKWFFFRVNNMTKDQKYHLAIINNVRQNKQYSNGIKIFTYSVQMNQQRKIGWHHSGDNVDLILNEIYQFSNNKRVCFNTLSFDYHCEYADDTVFFANCIPYTYTQLMTELKDTKDKQLAYYQQETLCKSLGGNDVEIYRIDSDNSDSSSSNTEKEGIILFARQHPSETVGSWVMKGVTDLLTGDSEEGKYIRANFEVLVIPMVNIDGVIAGNSRTSYAGCDINRKWNQPKKHKHPEIFFIKETIRQFSSKRKVMCLVDFHGYLSAFNSFFYSNYDESDINRTRAFPYACARSSSAINFEQCVFSMMKYKQGSSRISLYTEFGIENACTLETSGFGFDKGKYCNQYVNETILQEIGRDVCLGIVTYHYYKSKQLESVISISSVLKNRIQPVIEDLQEGKMNIKQEDFNDQNDCNSEDEGNNNTVGEANIVCNNEDHDLDKDKDNNNDNDKDNDNDNANDNNNNNEVYLPKLKSVRMKRIKIQLTNCNRIPKSSTSTLNLNSIIETKTSNNNNNTTITNTIMKSKSNMLLTLKKYNQPQLSSSLNDSLIHAEQSAINPLSDKLRLRYKTAMRVKECPNLPKQPQIFIPSLKQIKSDCSQSKRKMPINLATLPLYPCPSPPPAKKFYSTHDAYTQTESIFFDSKLMYCIGSYKILKYKYIKEKMELNRNRFNIMKSLTFKEDTEESIKINKETKSTQTRSNLSNILNKQQNKR